MQDVLNIQTSMLITTFMEQRWKVVWLSQQMQINDKSQSLLVIK